MNTFFYSNLSCRAWSCLHVVLWLTQFILGLPHHVRHYCAIEVQTYKTYSTYSTILVPLSSPISFHLSPLLTAKPFPYFFPWASSRRRVSYHGIFSLQMVDWSTVTLWLYATFAASYAQPESWADVYKDRHNQAEHFSSSGYQHDVIIYVISQLTVTLEAGSFGAETTPNEQ